MKNLKIEIKWAIIFSVIGLLWMFLEKLVILHSTHIDKHMYLTNLYVIPAIIVMVLALKDKKKNFYAGQMTYKQGLISGIIISVCIALLSPFTQWITSTIITPEYFPNVIAYAVKTGYHKSIEEAETYFNLSNYIVQSTIGALIMGIITTAIAMLFIRSKKQN